MIHTCGKFHWNQIQTHRLTRTRYNGQRLDGSHHIQGGPIKSKPCDFCWYFNNACRFLLEIFVQLFSNKIYTSNPIFSILRVVFTSLLVALKSRFVDDEMIMQTWRWTELLQMLNVTTVGSHSHVDSQTLGEVCYRLVDVFLWQIFPDGLQGDFQLISYLRLGWSLFCASSMASRM